MAIFNRFPFSNTHELNLDWILRQLKARLRRVKHLEESEGGGGGDPGTTNYNDLSNNPRTNNVTLQWNKTSADLNIPTSTTIRTEIRHELQLYDPAQANYDPPYPAGTIGNAIENAAIAPEDVQAAVDAYLDDHPTITGTFTNAAKSALISLLEKVAYIDGNGQQYLNELITNLADTVTSISAVFTQGAAVIYDTDSLDTLEQYLVVTADYSDGTSGIVTGYTLSGTLTVGTSTITATYGGQTDTFTVTVHAGLPSTYTLYDYIKNKATNPSGSATSLAPGQRITLKAYSILSALSAEIDFQTEADFTPATCLIGVRTASGNASSYAFYPGNNVMGYHLHGNDSTPTIPCTNNVKHTIKFKNTSASPSKLSIDDGAETSVEWVNTNTITNKGLVLLMNPYNDTSNFNLAKFIRVGRVKLFDLSGTLVGDYVPCVRTADSVIGMYDMIEQIFYTASTTAAVTIGNANCKYAVGNWS